MASMLKRRRYLRTLLEPRNKRRIEEWNDDEEDSIIKNESGDEDENLGVQEEANGFSEDKSKYSKKTNKSPRRATRSTIQNKKNEEQKEIEKLEKMIVEKEMELQELRAALSKPSGNLSKVYKKMEVEQSDEDMSDEEMEEIYESPEEQDDMVDFVRNENYGQNIDYKEDEDLEIVPKLLTDNVVENGYPVYDHSFIYNFLTSSSKNGMLDLLAVSKLLKTAIEMGYGYEPTLKKYADKFCTTVTLTLVNEADEIEYRTTNLCQYGQSVVNAFHTAQYQILAKKVTNVANDATIKTNHKYSDHLELGTLDISFSNVIHSYIVDAGDQFINCEMPLEKLPNKKPKDHAHVYLGKILKSILELICTDPPQIKKYSLKANDINILPPALISVIREFCIELFGLNHDAIRSPRQTMEMLQRQGFFKSLGTSTESRWNRLKELRSAYDKFEDVFAVKLSEKLSEVKQQQYIEATGNIPGYWLNRRHRAKKDIVANITNG